MKVGAEPKKVAMLGGLLLVLAFFLFSNWGGDVPPQPARAPARPAAPNPVAQSTAPADSALSQPAPQTRPRPPLRPESGGLRLSLKDRRVDPTTVDPTLRLDLLAKVQNVTLEGGARNLFQFGPAPMPKTPEPKIIPKPVVEKQPEEAPKPVEPPKPPPPPIPLKFYGYASNSPKGTPRAFFLQGDEIVVAAEGELIQRRYRIVKIGINSCVVEDTQSKHQQTLALEEQSG
ncbi:MAG: hypothetical protein ACM3S5_02590 [Rhodospirillales bacterium]